MELKSLGAETAGLNSLELKHLELNHHVAKRDIKMLNKSLNIRNLCKMPVKWAENHMFFIVTFQIKISKWHSIANRV